MAVQWAPVNQWQNANPACPISSASVEWQPMITQIWLCCAINFILDQKRKPEQWRQIYIFIEHPKMLQVQSKYWVISFKNSHLEAMQLNKCYFYNDLHTCDRSFQGSWYCIHYLTEPYFSTIITGTGIACLYASVPIVKQAIFKWNAVMISLCH